MTILTEKILNDILKYLRDWIVNHVQICDMDYADYLIKLGVK